MIACTLFGQAFAALLCAECAAGLCAPARLPAQPQLAARESGPPYQVTVSAGHATEIGGEGLTVELAGVTDNRCAVEVKCVWAGYAVVRLWVGKVGGPRSAVVVGEPAASPPTAVATPSQSQTEGPASPTAAPAAASYGLYRFELMALEPDHSIAQPVELSRYRARLRISKAAG